MAKRKKEADTASAATLRQRAEDVARHTAADLAAMPAHEVLALAHELQVH